jgi:DNA-binding NarL/FixJ family response regulator
MLADALTRRLAQEPFGLLARQSPGEVARVLDAVHTHGLDLLVVDAASVPGHWSALVDAVTSVAPDVPVVVLADTVDADDAVQAAVRGVSAWLEPRTSAADLIEVLQRVGAGHAFYPPMVLGEVLQRLLAEIPDRRVGSGPLASLTERELDVLLCLVEGRDGPEIAEHLDIAANTVRSHTNRILHKLGAHSRLDAVRVARENGFETTARASISIKPGSRLPQSDQDS